MKNFYRMSMLLALIGCMNNGYQLPHNPEHLLNTMSLRQKIAQCIIVAAVSNEQINKDVMAATPYHMDKKHVEDLITQEHIGGVIFLGGGLSNEQMQITHHFQQLSPEIPLLIALDAEWGLTMRLRDGMRYPRNMTLGALTDNELIYRMAFEIGKELAAIGVHINLAPVIDVNNNPDNPVINDRSFGSNTERVAQKGCAYLKGLHDAGIIDCVKHFPGHGDTDIDSHFALPTINHDRSHLDAIELVPFKAAIAAGAQAVMVAHIHVPALDETINIPASLSPKINTDLLRKELGFEGLIITDGLGMGGLTAGHTAGAIEVQALKAGADILLAPINVPEAINAIERAVQSGYITVEEINEKVLRILNAKMWAFAHSPALPTPRSEIIKLRKKLFARAITVAKDTLRSNRDTASDVVIAITGINKSKNNNFGISLEKIDEIKRLKALGKQVTVILYGSPYAVEFVQDADRIIVAYEDDAAAQEAVQQILAGFVSAEGTLPV